MTVSAQVVLTGQSKAVARLLDEVRAAPAFADGRSAGWAAC